MAEAESGRAGLGVSPARPGRPGRRGRQAWVMAGGAAQPGAELLNFAQFRDSSAQRLAYGYGARSLRELRAREFGRLAGEAGGDTCAGLARWPWGARGFWNRRSRSFCSRWERRYLIWDAFEIERP